ncbi:MAG: SDR family oxidoreductase [bacterium]|nr:SDR family oxidoreductase [bacterium]
MKRVLVLGATGMLGSMVYRYFRARTTHTVVGTVRTNDPPTDYLAFDAERDEEQPLGDLLERVQPNFIVNCVGVIKPYCRDDDPLGIQRALTVNALFPYRLAAAAERVHANVLQIATDCVYSGENGSYLEGSPHDPLDAYGKTKSLGEVKAERVLHLRCSIVGPELFRKVSLLEWFLHQEDGAIVQGFTHHRWNGVTTLQFAQCCAEIVNAEERFFDTLIHASPVHHFLPNATVTKYELLCILADVFGKRVQIEKANQPSPPIDRTLSSRFSFLGTPHGSKPLQDAVEELKVYMEKHTVAVPASRVSARS